MAGHKDLQLCFLSGKEWGGFTISFILRQPPRFNEGAVSRHHAIQYGKRYAEGSSERLCSRRSLVLHDFARVMPASW